MDNTSNELETTDEALNDEVLNDENNKEDNCGKEAGDQQGEEQKSEELNEQCDSANETTESRKKFKKKEKKEKKDPKDIRIEELTDKYTRLMAEFENFRKRTEKEKTAMYEVGAKSIVEKILPVVDNFERGLASVPDEQKEDPFVDGMDKIYKQFITSLEEAGVKPIEAVGNEFDPEFHNAVMHVEDEEQEENVVMEEFQKGYMYRDSVVRHSMVKVAN